MKIRKESFSEILFNWTAAFILLIMGILMLYPFYYLLVYSLNEPLDAMRGYLLLAQKIFICKLQDGVGNQ